MLRSGRLRGLRPRRVAAASCLIMLFGLLTVPAAADSGTDSVPEFNLDTGNAPLQVVYPAIFPRNRAISPTGSDATLVVDYVQLLEVSWFDAIAPFNPTAVGINSNLGRRPAEEQTTRNRNIAVVYSSYSLLRRFLPQFTADWRTMVSSAGLDPDYLEENTTTAAGIGNLAGRKTLENRLHDGLNREGEEGGVTYNKQRYADYTGYQPVNTAYQLRDPSRWQPQTVPVGNGIFTVQQFATPQMGITRPYSYDHPTQFSVPPPRNSNYARNPEAYKQQADQVLRASANLTDRQKMTAELFNDKFTSLGIVGGLAVLQGANYDVEKTVQFIATHSIADFDVTIATWYWKRKYDAVRPVSAIRHLYGNQRVTAWGGPGKGTVNDIRANEWRSYLGTADHPEYPSGSASLCNAYAEASRAFTGTDAANISAARPKGSSLVEPGITPAADMTLSWNSWTDFASDCGMSRNWAGVHFTPSIEVTRSYGTQIGRAAHDFVQRHIRGEV